MDRQRSRERDRKDDLRKWQDEQRKQDWADVARHESVSETIKVNTRDLKGNVWAVDMSTCYVPPWQYLSAQPAPPTLNLRWNSERSIWECESVR